MRSALVIDESRLSRCVVKELLREQGVQTVVEVVNAEEAEKAFQAQMPDLVTLDLGGGVELFDKIVSSHPGAKVLVIAEPDQDGMGEQLLRRGAVGVLRKPLSSDAFGAAFSKIVSTLPPAQAPAPEPAAPPKLRALIVDDSPMMRVMVRGIVEPLGLEVVGEAADVPDGIKAFELLRPDLVTLDMVMPGGSGLDVLKSIRKLSKDARVVMITSVSQTKVTDELRAEGADAILNKPLNKDGFKALLDGFRAAKPAAPSLGPEETDSLVKRVLELGGGRCAHALSNMCASAWAAAGSHVHKGAALREDLKGVPADAPVPVGVRMVVADVFPVTGLFLCSAESAQKMADLLTGGLGEAFGEGTVKAVVNEWGNIMITNYLNSISEALGSAVLCTPPEYLELPLPELLLQTLDKHSAGGGATATQNMLTCESLGIGCETWLIMPEAGARELARAAAKSTPPSA